LDREEKGLVPMPKKHKPTGSVSFHDPEDKEKQARYKEIIARAKTGSTDRPGDLEGTPRFDQLDPSWDRPVHPSSLSTKTAEGLGALSEATQEAEREEQQRKVEEGVDSGLPYSQIESVAKISEEEAAEPEKTKEEQLKAAIETRVESVDIGQYLMNGELSQKVPIIPGKLEVTFRTVTDLEECFVDDKLSKDGEITARAFLRRANEWALAFHIAEVNGHKWPTTIDGDGTVSDKSINRRLSHVRKLSSPIFHLLSQNLAWFLERVNDSLNMEALGNG
jgi:hypothetical protein